MVEDGADQRIGKISFPCMSCGPQYNISDRNGNQKYIIEQSCGEFCSKCCCGGDLELDIRTPDNQTVGKLGKTKKPRDFGRCCGTNCLWETFTYLKFPPQAPGEDRALLTAAGIWAGASVAFSGRPTKYTGSW